MNEGADGSGGPGGSGTCTYERTDGTRCQEPPLVGSKEGLCLFHAPVEAKDAHEAMRALLDRLDEGACDFEGFQLADADLSGRVFHSDVSFRNARFTGATSFREATFPEGTDLRAARFEGDVDLGTARFSHDAFLDGAEFRGDATFAGARFEGAAYFNEVRFSTSASFNRATFGDEVRFEGCSMGPDTDFDHAVLRGDAFFNDVRVQGRLYMGFASFEKYAFFVGASCQGKGDFSFASFAAYADFTGSSWKELDMTDAIFEKRGCFDRSVISRGTFEDAELRHVTFRDVDLSNVFTAGASLEEAYMSEARWGRPQRGPIGKKVVVREETLAEQEGTRDALRRAEAAMRNLKESYKREGAYETAGEFYIREMVIARRSARMDREYGAWLMSGLISVLCGYGERPSRVIFWWFAFVLTYAVVYFAGHLIAPSGEGDVEFATWRGFLTCLYFSVVTFTTLGFGDYQPVTDTGRAVASVEAFTGAFMIALFVLVFGRKMIR